MLKDFGTSAQIVPTYSIRYSERRCPRNLNRRVQVLAVMCVGALFAFVYMPVWNLHKCNAFERVGKAISETLEEDLALLMYWCVPIALVLTLCRPAV